MNILKSLLKRKSNEISKKAEGDKLSAVTLKSMRIYGALLSDSLHEIKKLGGLLDSPKIKYDPMFTNRLSLPIDINGFNTLIIIYSIGETEPLCAWLENTDNE